jgi:hypothetical protein
MTVQDAIAAAEQVLPGSEAPDDPRWKAIIAVADHIETDPELVWQFALRWGSVADADLQMAIGVCVLEHLLQHHFDRYISRIEEAVLADANFAGAASSCWKFGYSKSSAARSARFDRLKRLARSRSPRKRNKKPTA